MRWIKFCRSRKRIAFRSYITWPLKPLLNAFSLSEVEKSFFKAKLIVPEKRSLLLNFFRLRFGPNSAFRRLIERLNKHSQYYSYKILEDKLKQTIIVLKQDIGNKATKMAHALRPFSRSWSLLFLFLCPFICSHIYGTYSNVPTLLQQSLSHHLSCLNLVLSSFFFDLFRLMTLYDFPFVWFSCCGLLVFYLYFLNVIL